MHQHDTAVIQCRADPLWWSDITHRSSMHANSVSSPRLKLAGVTTCYDFDCVSLREYRGLIFGLRM